MLFSDFDAIDNQKKGPPVWLYYLRTPLLRCMRLIYFATLLKTQFMLFAQDTYTQILCSN